MRAKKEQSDPSEVHRDTKVQCIVCWEYIKHRKKRVEALLFYDDYVKLVARSTADRALWQLLDSCWRDDDHKKKPGICAKCQEGIIGAIKEWEREHDMAIRILRQKAGKKVYEDGDDEDEEWGEGEE